MKNRQIIFILAVLFLVGFASTGAGDMTKNDDKIAKTKEQIQKEFPNLTVNEVVEGPVGIFEVTSGDKIFWWKDGYVIFGEIYSKDGVSTTAEKKKRIWSTKINRVPL